MVQGQVELTLDSWSFPDLNPRGPEILRVTETSSRILQRLGLTAASPGGGESRIRVPATITCVFTADFTVSLRHFSCSVLGAPQAVCQHPGAN